MEHQQVQSESTNEAPESTIRDTNGAPERQEVFPKRSTSKSNQRAQMKHQKAQSETTKGAPENQQKNFFSRDFHLQLILIGQLTQLSQYYFALQSLHKALPSTTLYYKACTKHFPVLRCTTKLAQSTSQYYFVLQSLHKALPSTLYYKACTSYFPVLLCTTKLAKSISQYYFVQQSLQKVFLSTTLYYKVAQSTSQYYFVVQSLHKARSITTLL